MAMIILTVMFLVITTLQSNNRKLYIWKSSTTSVLCSTLDENIHREIIAHKDPMKIENLTNSAQARLEAREDGREIWRFV
jgi:hypothetical protein